METLNLKQVEVIDNGDKPLKRAYGFVRITFVSSDLYGESDSDGDGREKYVVTKRKLTDDEIKKIMAANAKRLRKGLLR